MVEEVRRWKIERVKEAATACNKNDLDPKTWWHWAETLLELAGLITDKTYGAPEIADAITKLKKCLELKPEDPLEVKWKIGESLMVLMWAAYPMPNDVYAQCCNEAIQFLNEVRAVNPEYEKDSGLYEMAQEGLEYLSSLNAPKFSPLEVELLEKSEVAKQACKDNPGDAKNWEKWVMSLVRLKGIMDEKELDKDMLTDAKKRLKEALKKDGVGLGLMWSLGEVYLLLVSADPSISESEHLYRKHCEKAINCFDDVRFIDNDFGRGSTGPYIARQGLEYVKHSF